MRHRQRHVHKTILEYLRAQLDDGDWFGDPAPYGATPVTLIDYEPQEAGHTPELNTVAVSMGYQGEDLPEEMGGGLHRCEYAVFFDVYGESEPIAVSIADDIKQAINGNIISLLNYTTEAEGEATDAQIEFEDIEVDKPPVATTTLDKRSWRVVKATACVYF